MALTEAAWKKVLDQPKNLGLKAAGTGASGGTGVSKCLHDVELAKTLFDNQHDLDKIERAGTQLVSRLHELQAQCDVVVKKHGKLFTTACAYLTQLKAEAGRAVDETRNKIEAEQKALAREHKFEERAKESGDERTAMDHIAKTYAAQFEHAKDIEGLHKLLGDFVGAFGPVYDKYALNPSIHDIPLQVAYEQVRALHNKNGEFKAVHDDCIAKTGRLLHALEHPPENKPYQRPI